MRWAFICGWDVEVGVICNLTAYECIWSQVMCETFLLFKGVCAKVGYLCMGSRQPVHRTTDCGQAHDVQHAVCGAGSE